MTLQEAEQYKEQCEESILHFSSYLSSPENVYLIREEHRRKDIDPEAENEIIIRDPSQRDGFTAQEVLQALEKLLDEYEGLQRAIAFAKLQAETDIDRAETLQEHRRSFCDTLRMFPQLVPGTTVSMKKGHIMDAGGRLVSYDYEMETIDTPLLSQKSVTTYLRETEAEIEKWQEIIDCCRREMFIDYRPCMRVEGTIKEIVMSLREQ